MGRWQPYLYNDQRQSQYNEPEVFNPRAVTMASMQPPSPKKKQEGPLIDFNKHPDSYLILPYGRTDAKPMSSKVKVMIYTARWIQFVFRVCTLLGAIGALLCGIFIRGMGESEGWIIRIPPGIDLVVSLYAIYHLLRSAKSRPAGSSASYHFFALIMDAGFIPFYVFTTLLAKRNFNVEAGTEGRWRTFFPTDEETNKVLQSTWLIATAVGGLHIASLVLDLYLVLVFRKISRLPPDMNPLEDNLTSRRKTKHKHKTSSLSAITPLTGDSKRFSAQSGATTIVGSRYSQADPLISEKEIPAPNSKQMAFMHTRTNSDVTYSPHTPRSAEQSRHSMYSQAASTRQSRADLNHRDDLLRGNDAADDEESLAQRKSFLAQQAIKRSSRPQSVVSSQQEYYTPPTTGDKKGFGDIALQNNVRNSRESLQSDNWFVYEGSAHAAEVHVAPKKSMFVPKKTQGYNTVSAYDVSDEEELDGPMMPQPLRMNPPTPPPVKTLEAPVRQTPPSKLQRTLTTTSMSSEATFSRSPTRAGTIKSRYYGDLKAATNGIRSSYSPSNSPGPSPVKSGFEGNGYASAAKAYTTNASSPTKNAMTNSPISLGKKSYTSVKRTGEMGYAPIQGQSPRVLSRSGVDYDGRYDFDDSSDLGTPGRRREVSGKVAEEGRGGVANLASRWGGMRGSELTYRKVSGVA
ncbi:hypothetical protein B0J11DRAFT_276762 [Dendryphion nanum]|uniref:Uncharacterized protein n=1 Tax=Dendryphion nanum TaxID=256645 RepID=A0A9P9E0V3_9PLEO|nr:hypothetical protein B0J11DRAFT_276762 [Dendryphion nanum]